MRSQSLRALLGALAGVALLATAAPAATLAANPEGQLDTSFSGDGKLVLSDDSIGIEDGVLLPDGRMVFAGSWNTGTGNEFLVMRLTAAGDPDTTFSSDGVFHQAINGESSAKHLVVQSDGKLVVVGDNDPNFILARLTTSGALDTTFGGGTGYVVSRLGSTDSANADGLAVTPEGRILISGEWNIDGTHSDGYVARYTSAGALDAGFGAGGIRFVALDQYDYYLDLALQPDGRIITVGGTGDDSTTSALVTRLTASGAVDTSYHTTGSYTRDLGDNAYGTLVRIDRFDRAVVQAGGHVVRVTTGGNADTTFAGDGSIDGLAQLNAITLAANGKIVVAGRNGGNDLVVQRIDEWGNLDGAFGSGGTSTNEITSFDFPVGLGIAANGRITVFGMGQSPDFVPFVVRLIGDATTPYGAKILSLPVVSTATTRTLQWTASDDNTGIADYTVRFRSAAFSSTTLGSSSTLASATTAASRSFTGSAGRQYCFQVKATDVAGNAAPYSQLQCTILPINDRSLTRTGSWSSPSSSAYYRGTASSSTSSGAKLTKTGVRYRRLALVVTTCSSCGTVKVYRGSTLLKTISLASSTTKHKVVVTVDVQPELQSGTITIKQASGGRKVIVEGLAVGLY